MYSGIKHRGLAAFVRNEGPAIGAALLVAELFYKFHSFVLECVAFLGTWYVLGVLWHAARGILRPAESERL